MPAKLDVSRRRRDFSSRKSMTRSRSVLGQLTSRSCEDLCSPTADGSRRWPALLVGRAKRLRPAVLGFSDCASPGDGCQIRAFDSRESDSACHAHMARGRRSAADRMNKNAPADGSVGVAGCRRQTGPRPTNRRTDANAQTCMRKRDRDDAAALN